MAFLCPSTLLLLVFLLLHAHSFNINLSCNYISREMSMWLKIGQFIEIMTLQSHYYAHCPLPMLRSAQLSSAQLSSAQNPITTLSIISTKKRFSAITQSLQYVTYCIDNIVNECIHDTHTHIWHLMAWANLSGVFVKALNCCSTPNTTKCLDSEFNSVWVKVIDRNKLWIMWWCTHVNVRSNQWLRRFFFFLLILLLFLFSDPLPLVLNLSLRFVCLAQYSFFQWKKTPSKQISVALNVDK